MAKKLKTSIEFGSRDNPQFKNAQGVNNGSIDGYIENGRIVLNPLSKKPAAYRTGSDIEPLAH